MPDRHFDPIFIGAAAFGGGERSVLRQVGPMDDLAERLPFLVAPHRNREPLILADTGKTAMRHKARMAVAEPGADGAIDGLLDH